MGRSRVVVVWLKRDLRLADHAPLTQALATGLPVVLLYLWEPSLLAAPGVDLRHHRFAYQCLADLQQALPQGHSLWMCHAEAVAALEQLAEVVEIAALFSHQETGSMATFTRDKAVGAWLRHRGIAWHQAVAGGVERGRTHRQGWPEQWYRRMAEPLLPVPAADLLAERLLPPPAAWQPTAVWQKPELLAYAQPNPQMQPGGRTAGLRYQDSFYEGRGRAYAWAISKPTEARRACSRLSPYLALGALSLREVYQRVAAARRTAPEGWQRPLAGLADRLRWRDHFIQKFEQECAIEGRNFNRGYDLLPQPLRPERVEAWQQGRTGYPLVDAAMRCVVQTGYLNFRLRAMLVSFLCHALWQPWQAGALWLGRQFLDYEIGIHIPQFQMQAGTVGIHVHRIYNPIKQGQDHDPAGHFVRRWVPELAHVPAAYIHEPWLLSGLDRALYKAEDYPAPIVAWEEAYHHARTTLWAHKTHTAVRAEAQRILARHTYGNRMA